MCKNCFLLTVPYRRWVFIFLAFTIFNEEAIDIKFVVEKCYHRVSNLPFDRFLQELFSSLLTLSELGPFLSEFFEKLRARVFFFLILLVLHLTKFKLLYNI